jgi:hypothetical protein
MRNVYERFHSLSGRLSRTVGLCVESELGAAIIEFPSSAKVKVKGAGIVGQRYFIEGDRIVGEAPDLPTLEIEI